MKNWTDEELQDLFENDPEAFEELARTNEDARLYALLFAAFPLLDAVEVPVGFSQTVMAQLEIKEARAKKWQNLLLVVGIFLSVLLGFFMSWILSPEMAKSFQAFSSYLPYIAAAVLIFFGVELLDQKVVWGDGTKGPLSA
ncbi:hypothetical protein [Persicitalea jodogahamensis]|uniref:Uncharacterized protein n=1 Tax=Persicitalea jodogahamensis TaxID=402147 RepID=A0A8J3GB60_9BACT|nr:hypothetical protein [Persicitalea jodogahamensis]GHB79521.1 hypothetical protein GCM10007390_36930 [Persicitalea jodogahamensis]